jgi:hypothetical protein
MMALSRSHVAAALALMTFLTSVASAKDDSTSPANLKKFRAKEAAKVKSAIADRLKDPDSAKFRRMSSDTYAAFFCGEVNAKNSMGGYVGYKRFYAIGADTTRLEGDELFFEDLWAENCSTGGKGSKFKID